MERSLRSGLESHNFLTWSMVALIRSLHEKKLLPMDDPVISQLQKSFSKACGNVASCLTSNAAFVTLKRRQLLLSHVVPPVSDAQKRNLLSDPFFQTSSLFSASSVEAARSAARDLSLFKPHLKASSSTNQPRRPTYSSSSAQRDSARHSSRPSSSQRTSSPYRQQSGRKGDSRIQKKSSGTPPETRGFSEVGALSLSGGRRLPSQLLAGLEGSGGVDAWVVEALRVGYRIPFERRPPLSERPLSLPAYSPQSIKGVALTQELQTLLRKGAVEPAPQSPGFYSRLFFVQKASGSWRPIIDLSTLNDFITSSHFHMETPQSVLRSIRLGDWMISLDLQDAYLQVPVHHDSRRYLRFVVAGKSYQFRVLCFGLTTTPQVFTRIMAPVSAILHKYGVRMLRYLDDWLILAATELAYLQSRDRLLSLCTELGIQVNLTKSSLVPTQSLVYLGMEIQSLPFIARPTPVRVSNLLRLIEEFLSTPSPPTSLWRRLLGHLSSLTLLVSGGMLRMRLLQLCLKDQWDFLDDQFQVSWSPLCREDPLWWARVAQLCEGVSLSLPVPDVSFFSDASDVGWGALVGEHHASGLWSPHQKTLSINLRELLAVQYGLKALEHLLVGLSVALFCDNTTTVAYLRRSGGTFSSTLNATAREILLWAENRHVRFLPQFIMGSSNVTADALSRPNQVIGSEWTLHQEVVDQLVHKWPAVIDLFATSLTARLPVYFSPASDPRAAGADALLQPWDDLQAYAFPPIAIIRRVLVKLRSSRNCELTLIAPFWPQREWFPDLLELLSDVPITLSSRKDLLRQPHFHRFHQNLPHSIWSLCE